MATVYQVIGFIAAIFGWILIVYALIRNQKAAAGTIAVDTSNFGPRIGAIVEVTLHPDHAAGWWRFASNGWIPNEDLEEFIDFIELDDGGQERYLIRVFPMIGLDSSEVFGVREDDRSHVKQTAFNDD